MSLTSVMKLSIKKSTTTIHLGLGIAVLFGIFLFSFVALKPMAASAQDKDGRLITVHDRGADRVFVTNKATLKEAFEEQGIAVDKKDAVEPSLNETLVAQDYQVNIYRARPVTIIDGATRQKVVTPYQSAERIVRDAGISLYPEDTTTLTRSTDLVGDGAGLELTIHRATPISVDLFGTVTSLRTQASTVGDMLKEKEISLGANDRVSVALSAPITADMSLRVWREGKQTITVDEDVTFATEEVKDADREVGYTSVQTPGQNGKRSVTYEVEIQNGAEVARKEVTSITTQEPVTQVVIVGSKPKSVLYTGGGSKTDWLAASNISQENWGYADYIVQRESGWNPNSRNSGSGACGLAQALPCSKLGSNWSDPVVSLNWMNNYVSRYGGWAGAYNFWLSHGWY